MFNSLRKSNSVFFFQAEDGIRDLRMSRGLGDVYKRQGLGRQASPRMVAQRRGKKVAEIIRRDEAPAAETA